MQQLAAIVGPTASGKTELAIKIAQRLNGEIISCDSMQIYKGMDIGTAKASPEEQLIVPHHLIDIIEIDEEFSVADFQRYAHRIIAGLNEKKKLPILAGGTGLYYQAVVDDYQFFPLPKKKAVREKWDNFIRDYGLQSAYNKLQEVDIEYSKNISVNDQKRIVRALEVYELTGKPFSQFQNSNKNKYNLAVVGLHLERQELYNRINQRVEQMLEKGLIEEVIQLRAKANFNKTLNSMQALGYKQVNAFLDGFISREEMVEEVKRETRRFAKRQLTWFNKDKRIFWISIEKNTNNELILEKICTYIEGQLSRV